MREVALAGLQALCSGPPATFFCPMLPCAPARGPQANDWRGDRAGAITSRSPGTPEMPAVQRPGNGSGGCSGDDLATPVRQAGRVHAQREGNPGQRSPSTGKGRPQDCRRSRLDQILCSPPSGLTQSVPCPREAGAVWLAHRQATQSSHQDNPPCPALRPACWRRFHSEPCAGFELSQVSRADTHARHRVQLVCPGPAVGRQVAKFSVGANSGVTAVPSHG